VAERGVASWPRRAARRARRVALDALGHTRFGTVTSVATDQPLVALTFDDGPDPLCTPRILDVLAAHGAKATFFVVGDRVERHPEVVERIHREGHALGHHSHRHPNFTLVPSSRRLAELRACAAALAPYPQARRLFRPPHLDQTLASRFDAWRLGFDVVACNRHIGDWKERSGAELEAALDRTLLPGDIVLLHDTLHDRPGGTRAPLVAALDAVLGRRSADLRFVTLHELLAAGPARRAIWLKRPNGRRALAAAPAAGA